MAGWAVFTTFTTAGCARTAARSPSALPHMPASRCSALATCDPSRLHQSPRAAPVHNEAEAVPHNIQASQCSNFTYTKAPEGRLALSQYEWHDAALPGKCLFLLLCRPTSQPRPSAHVCCVAADAAPALDTRHMMQRAAGSIDVIRYVRYGPRNEGTRSIEDIPFPHATGFASGQRAEQVNKTTMLER